MRLVIHSPDRNRTVTLEPWGEEYSVSGDRRLEIIPVLSGKEDPEFDIQLTPNGVVVTAEGAISDVNVLLDSRRIR